eukprot:GFYU01007299.1.p1 GENE.GFYU01007299.1~~GFYU01007299.1.p1  ORF type:complete len:176 (-),score=45.50 GFYU01007299.1:185-712(-)
MPGGYHSTFNEAQCQQACTCGILPLKTTVKGPAPPHLDPGKDDIIDEALTFFKANVFFRNFDMKGPADRTLVYLTCYITTCLKALERTQTKEDGKKTLTTLALDSFSVPGDNGFALGGFFQPPKDRSEADLWRGYIKQCREELGNRLVELAFTAEGKPNKWWMCFSKKKFMKLTL